MDSKRIIQVASVVDDLDEAMKRYSQNLGVKKWSVYELKPPELKEATYRNQPAEWSILLCFTSDCGLDLELIQPVKGPTIFQDYLQQKGQGLHHIKVLSSNCEETIKEYKKNGIGVVQSGRFFDISFYFLDTDPSLGFIIEVANEGNIREPDKIVRF